MATQRHAHPATPNQLAAYHAKRDFCVTPEPRGAVAAPSGRLRYVIQKHAARRLHYDFRLELDGTLKSWAVPKGPSTDPADKRLAVEVEDHPLDYIDFEGDIPAHQYGAGHVDVWDSGYWEPLGDARAGYAAGKLKFRLDGERLHGAWTLVRTHLPGSGGKPQWLLIKDDIDAALPSAAPPVDARALSDPAAASGAVRRPLPDTLRPQLATLVEAIPQSGDWIWEIKFDGYRLLARIDHDDVRLYTRDGKDWTAKLPQQADAIRALRMASGWLDGEIVALDAHGMPSFQLLQNAFDRHCTAQILFFVFDLPYLDGVDLRAVPLAQRQHLLRNLLRDAGDGLLRVSEPIRQPPQQLLDSACRLAMEGIIGKRSDAPYAGKRSADWIKLKCRARQEFVIAGFTEPQGTRKFFGALLLGVYDDAGRLHYTGRVGTGFSRENLHAIHRRLKPIKQARSPFDAVPAGTRFTHTHWVRPLLVAEVSFAEWTQDGLVRQASFDGLRADKPAAQVRREQPVSTAERRVKPAARTGADGSADNAVHGIRISHPERILDAQSGLTKLDLARYYEAIAPQMLPFLRQRPVYLLRCPDGVDGEHFFQKHHSRVPIPGIVALDPALDPGHAPLMAIESAAALVGAAQMGSVELHGANATADRIDRPDCMVFDLDPDPALPWERVVEGARLTKVVLDELGLRSFVKTSGGKGLHLTVPLSRRHSWDEVAAFSRAVAQHLARMLPQLFAAKMGEQNRVGKIFVDTLRNRRHASTVLPYSARARPGLPVATPVAWDELDTVESAAMWTVATLHHRLARQQDNPWRDYFTTRQMLTAAMRRKLGLAAK